MKDIGRLHWMTKDDPLYYVVDWRSETYTYQLNVHVKALSKWYVAQIDPDVEDISTIVRELHESLYPKLKDADLLDD